MAHILAQTFVLLRERERERERERFQLLVTKELTIFVFILKIFWV